MEHMILSAMKIPADTLSTILGLLGIEWVEKSQKICQRYFPGSEFNLAKYFIELLVRIIEKEDSAIAKELKNLSHNINDLKKLIKKYEKTPSLFKKNLFKNGKLSEFLKEYLKDKIILSRQIEAKILIDYCSKFLEANCWWNARPSRRNKRYSKTKWCIMEVAWVYHALTKKLPECRHNGSQEGTDKEYSGEFYEFLLEIKPLLKCLGIVLVENSLGEYTQVVLKQHEKTLSFLNIEVPMLQ